mmetsp:Transcript_21367/g.63240  ORF Transcript_21367/g.63240 Transcript_21367/m.63240 type:complete len:389 (+) Transcript_21367:736-1902(+)
MESCVYSCKCQVASRSDPDAVATHRAACSAQVPRAASEAGRHDAHVVLGGGDGAPHRLDRLAGELADGALPGEHHRVAAVEDCVRDVADLGARWHGRVDHRLHHLRRGDAKLVRLVCLLDEELLGEGDPLQAELNAEVAARHHQPVGEGEDLVNVLEGRRLLDLRDDEGALLLGHPLCVHDVDQLLDVAALLHERDRHVVHLVDQVRGVVAVLGGEGGAVDLQVGHVDTLAGLERPADCDLAADGIGRDALRHLHREEAVVEQHVHPNLKPAQHRVLLRRVGEGDPAGDGEVGVALHERHLDRLADDQLDRLSLHGAAPELWALQVSEDVDFAAELGGGGADDWNDPLEVAALPVRRVEAKDVETGLDELLDHLGGHGRRPQRADHLP